MANASDPRYWSQPTSVEQRTLASLPPSPPQIHPGSFEIIGGINDRTVVVFWQELDEKIHNGDNFRYTVTDVRQESQSEPLLTVITTSTYMEFQKVGLGQQSIFITSENSMGQVSLCRKRKLNPKEADTYIFIWNSSRLQPMQRLWFLLPESWGISSQSHSLAPSIQKTMYMRRLGILPMTMGWLFPTPSSGANVRRIGRITVTDSSTGRRSQSRTQAWRQWSTTSPFLTEETTRWQLRQTPTPTPQVFSSPPALPLKTILPFFLGQDFPGIIHQSALFRDFCSDVLNLVYLQASFGQPAQSSKIVWWENWRRFQLTGSGRRLPLSGENFQKAF